MMQTGAITRVSEQTSSIGWPGLVGPESPEKVPEWHYFRHPLQQLLTIMVNLPSPSHISTISLSEEVRRILRLLEDEGVHLKHLNRVEAHLLEFPNIMDVLPKAVQAAKKHLPEAQLILDVYRDPEIQDCYLVLCVRLKNYDESFMDRLEAAEAEFIDHLADKEGWLQLTTDFRQPETGNGF